MPNCKSGAMENIVHHTITKDPDLQIKWLKACGRYPPPTVSISNYIQLTITIHLDKYCCRKSISNSKITFCIGNTG